MMEIFTQMFLARTILVLEQFNPQVLVISIDENILSLSSRVEKGGERERER